MEKLALVKGTQKEQKYTESNQLPCSFSHFLIAKYINDELLHCNLTIIVFFVFLTNLLLTIY